MHRLDRRILVVWSVRALITASVLGALTLAAHTFVGIPDWAAGVIFTAALILGVVLAIARYKRWRYEIRDDSLYLERGVFTQIRTIVPHVRIQHVDTRRTPIERLTGLASTVVYTAGSRGADVRIPGLTPLRAHDLQERLKRLAIHAEGEDAV